MIRLQLVLIVVLSGCAPQGFDGATAEDRLQVVTDFSLLAEFAGIVGGDLVSVHSIVPLGVDPHTYEPRPGDATRLTGADLVLEHGLGLSPWMDGLGVNASEPVVAVGDVVAEQAVTGEDGILDPHLWMAPPFAGDYVTAIADALVASDPGAESEYRANAEAYRARLVELDAELSAAFATIPEQHRTLVTPHDAYRYFSEHFGLTVIGTLVGVTTEEEPSAQRASELIDAVRASGVPAVFIESTVPTRQIERVAQDAGVELAGPLYGDSLGGPGSGAETYLGMMRSNAATIVEALGGEWP